MESFLKFAGKKVFFYVMFCFAVGSWGTEPAEKKSKRPYLAGAGWFAKGTDVKAAPKKTSQFNKRLLKSRKNMAAPIPMLKEKPEVGSWRPEQQSSKIALETNSNAEGKQTEPVPKTPQVGISTSVPQSPPQKTASSPSLASVVPNGMPANDQKTENPSVVNEVGVATPPPIAMATTQDIVSPTASTLPDSLKLNQKKRTKKPKHARANPKSATTTQSASAASVAEPETKVIEPINPSEESNLADDPFADMGALDMNVAFDTPPPKKKMNLKTAAVKETAPVEAKPLAKVEAVERKPSSLYEAVCSCTCISPSSNAAHVGREMFRDSNCQFKTWDIRGLTPSSCAELSGGSYCEKAFIKSGDGCKSFEETGVFGSCTFKVKSVESLAN